MEILRKVNDFAQNEKDMQSHVQKMWFFHVFLFNQI